MGDERGGVGWDMDVGLCGRWVERRTGVGLGGGGGWLHGEPAWNWSAGCR